MQAPSLLSHGSEQKIPRSVFTDLQLQGLLSEDAIAVLSSPCPIAKISQRQELLGHLQSKDFLTLVTDCLTKLKLCRRAYMLSQAKTTALESAYRQAELLEAYLHACEALSTLADGGTLFKGVSEYFSEEARVEERSKIANDLSRIRQLLEGCSRFLLSFSDKNWITPDTAPNTEYDEIVSCADALGLKLPAQKALRILPDKPMSDAIMTLFDREMSEIRTLLAVYDGLNTQLPCSYIGEIEFYIEIHALTERADAAGIPCCFPKISSQKQYLATRLYDVSLLAKGCDTVVPNDACFTGKDPFYFLTGANGGGKTTYLRAVGINLLLFLAGCPVFAEQAEIYPFAAVLTHCPKDERFDRTGRLDEELARAEEMLEVSDAFLLFNETFSGTDQTRGLDLVLQTAEKMKANHTFGLFVTHFHEVNDTSYPVLTVKVDTLDENRRTYQIAPKSPTRSSYANDILKKYRLDRASLAERRRQGDTQPSIS